MLSGSTPPFSQKADVTIQPVKVKKGMPLDFLKPISQQTSCTGIQLWLSL